MTQKTDNLTAVKRRRGIQWVLLPIVIITIALGWRFPMLGFSVPIVMLMGLVGGMFRGRYVCGNLCPRGSLLDRIIARIGLNKPIPAFMRNKALRWSLFALMMGFMAVRAAKNPGDIYHWGRVFWMMCVITTAIGVVGGILVHPRLWCAICPMGTMQNAVGGGKYQLEIDADACRECKLCEKVCPMDLKIVCHKSEGRVAERDCLKCGECLAACPTSAFRWPG